MVQTTEDSDRHHNKQFERAKNASAGRLDHLLGSRTVSVYEHLALFYCCCLNFLGKFPHEQACNEC